MQTFRPFIVRFLEAVRRPGNHRIVMKNAEEIGYFVATDADGNSYLSAPVATPCTQQVLLSILPYTEWREIEHNALVDHANLGSLYGKTNPLSELSHEDS